MDIYYLCFRGARPAHVLSNPLGASRSVVVRGAADWYAARARAFEHAAAAGSRFVMVVTGLSTAFKARRDAAGAVHACPRTPYTDHALVLYVARLLRQHVGAVLVPPGGALRQIPACGVDLLPTMPVCAGYRTAAVMENDYTGPGLEFGMVSSGYLTTTLGDFGVLPFHPPGVLDTYGTHTKWKQAHEKALRPFL